MSTKIQKLPFVIIKNETNNEWKVFYRNICLEIFNDRESAMFFAEMNNIKNYYGK